MTLLRGSGPPEDVQGQLEALIAHYPAASSAARDSVRAMYIEYERLLDARQTCRLIRRASFHPPESCRSSSDGDENIPGVSQNRRASDMPEFDFWASTGGKYTNRCSKDMPEKASQAGSADLCQIECGGNEAEPHSAGDSESRLQSAGSAEGGWPTEGYSAYFGRLRRRCMQEAAGQGGGREAALQLLATALPGKGLDEIRELDRRRSMDSRRRHMQAASSADAGRRAARLLARAEARLARSAEAAEQRAQAAAEAAIREGAKGKQRAELAVMAQRCAAAAAQAELVRSAAEQALHLHIIPTTVPSAAQAAAAEAEKRQRAQQRARESDTAALAQHKDAAVARQESVLHSHAVAAAAAALQSQQRAAADAARVAHRERLRAEKAAARDAAAAADAAAAHRRERRILDLAAQASP
ncbi:hypothetical protein COCOBI_02-0910 [Coccomyxa sp. Obi]|nr:hypothetical protein COCOBI_02-0910 [Coccomyxa sp. Obi]